MSLIYTNSQPLYNAQKNKEYINVTDIHQQSTMPLELKKKEILKNRFSGKKNVQTCFTYVTPSVPMGFLKNVQPIWFSRLGSYSFNIYVICIINIYEQELNIIYIDGLNFIKSCIKNLQNLSFVLYLNQS